MALFSIYTYQFSPLPIQGELFDEFYIEKQRSVMENKNDIFRQLIQSTDFVYRNKKHSVCFFPKDKDLIVFRISNIRTMLLEKDFKKNPIVDEPSSLVITYNSPLVQRIAIQQNNRAFNEDGVIVRIIQSSLKHSLSRHGLRMTIRKEYENQEFWKLVDNNPCQISMVRFEFDYPNLPRVAEKVDSLLRDLSKDVYSGKTKLEFNAPEKEVLNLNRNDETLYALSKASSSSGNPIVLKIKGFKKYVKTGNSTKTIDIDEVEIEAQSGEEIKDIFNRIDE